MSPQGSSYTYCRDSSKQDDENKRKHVKVVVEVDLESESESPSDKDEVNDDADESNDDVLIYDDENKRKHVKVEVLDLESESESTIDKDERGDDAKAKEVNKKSRGGVAVIHQMSEGDSSSEDDDIIDAVVAKESSSDEKPSVSDDSTYKEESFSDEDTNRKNYTIKKESFSDEDTSRKNYTIKKESSSDEDTGRKNDTIKKESSSDEDMRRKKVKKIKSSKYNGAAKSEYELMREKNKAEHLKFIASLKIDEAKADLLDVLKPCTKTSTGKRPWKKQVFKEEIKRKSRRLVNRSRQDLSEEALFHKSIVESQNVVRSKGLPPELTFKAALKCKSFHDNMDEDLKMEEQPIAVTAFVSYDKNLIQSISANESYIANVTPASVMTLAWYPSADSFIIAGGDEQGKIGVLNLASGSNSHVFETHLRRISKLEFNPSNPTQLVSSSYDGTLRSGDMVKQVFSEMYNVSDESSCSYFDFLSPTICLVAQMNGEVALVDNRTRRREKRHTCHTFPVRTVNVHPVNGNYFLTADNHGFLRLWDLRRLREKPVADITHHKRGINSAYFNPVTGNTILTTSYDNTICVFDSTNLTVIPLVRTIMHNNNCHGIFAFKASWLPNSDEAFVVGSVQHPRRIEVFDLNMNINYTIMHKFITQTSSTNVFHPFRPALAGTKCNGQILVFT